jgi:hypothetical protein
MKIWEYGALGIQNPHLSPLKPYFDLVRSCTRVTGDILELGVSQGASIITSALLLTELESDKKIFGLDTFSGFPNYSAFDSFSEFESLLNDGLIDQDHFELASHNLDLVKLRGSTEQPSSISTSKDFRSTSYSLVQSKVDALDLTHHVKLFECDVTTGIDQVLGKREYCLVLLDLDLYDGYRSTLPYVFECLVPGGYIYLDEYYSLKFPGPRRAVHEFLELESEATLLRLPDWLDFQRWVIQKPS